MSDENVTPLNISERCFLNFVFENFYFSTIDRSNKKWKFIIIILLYLTDHTKPKQKKEKPIFQKPKKVQYSEQCINKLMPSPLSFFLQWKFWIQLAISYSSNAIRILFQNKYFPCATHVPKSMT